MLQGSLLDKVVQSRSHHFTIYISHLVVYVFLRHLQLMGLNYKLASHITCWNAM